ncbi:MAG TPA: hypothetical protein VFC78_01585 [Tepidisphaeraceae bacterium]|nr:hypothetical protein [Tepidisphaeraceae bacterium]
MKRTLTFAAGALLAAVMFGDGPSAAQPQTAPAVAASRAIATTGVRSIDLPQIDTPMPAGPNQFAFTANCTLCHTPRYVLMQPAFSRKTWEAEVLKMKKAYGAPLTDTQVEPIVSYLVSVHGNGK